MQSLKAEPFKLWLAKVDYERIQEIAAPEKSVNRARDPQYNFLDPRVKPGMTTSISWIPGQARDDYVNFLDPYPYAGMTCFSAGIPKIVSERLPFLDY